jgi:hypothetical protein
MTRENGRQNRKSTPLSQGKAGAGAAFSRLLLILGMAVTMMLILPVESRAGALPAGNAPAGNGTANCNGESSDGGTTACGDKQTTGTPLTVAATLGGQCGGCACEDISELLTRNVLENEYEQERQFITQQFVLNQNYLANDFFTVDVLPGLRMMTEQLVSNGMNQMLALGAIMDAKVQMDTQRLLQRRTADAHKDYQTDNDMCVYGTAASHMTSSDLRGRLTAHVLAKRSLDRQLGNLDSSAADGPDQDAMARLQVVRNLYCNPNDNMQQVSDICYPGGALARRNRDIDYARVMENNTLDLNFSDTAVSNDEADIFALSNYLYAQHPFSRIPHPAMRTIEGQTVWMDSRAVIAKHSVAENSFDNIVGMRSTSPDDMTATAQYLGVVFQRMGVSQQDGQRIVGGMDKDSNAINKPSYYSMLQIMSQAIYQTPSFYANLYDTPTNVRRKEVAMQASRLMVDRDSYVSELREEAVLDELLEAEVVKGQERLSNAASRIKRGERTNPAP